MRIRNIKNFSCTQIVKNDRNVVGGKPIADVVNEKLGAFAPYRTYIPYHHQLHANHLMSCTVLGYQRTLHDRGESHEILPHGERGRGRKGGTHLILTEIKIL